jgi:hypothetical protein
MGCKPHGLRKAAARRLAEAGCSANEIATSTGHKTLAEVERYTRAADQARLAQQAIRRQIDAGGGKPPLDEVANEGGQALEINSLTAKLALLSEARKASKIKGLRTCLGKWPRCSSRLFKNATQTDPHSSAADRRPSRCYPYDRCEPTVLNCRELSLNRCPPKAKATRSNRVGCARNNSNVRPQIRCKG